MVGRQSETDVWEIDNLLSEVIDEEAIDQHARWPEMTLEKKRRVSELMVRTIVIGEGDDRMQPGAASQPSRVHSLAK